MPSAARCEPEGSLTEHLRARVTSVLSALLVVLGTVAIIETALIGGGAGYVLGAILMLAGGLRLYLSFR